ncbi:MAG: hypothetical protein V1492_06025 [Candidatus Micrarchaeota archaeon]
MKKEIFVLLLLTVFAFAAPPVSLQELMDKKYDMVSCRVTLLTTLLDQAPGYNVTVDSSVSPKLTSDLAALKSAADSGSKTDFRSVMDSLRADAKDALSTLRDAKRQLAQQPNEVKEQARSDFTAAKQTETDCLQIAALDFAKSEVADAQYFRDHGQDIVNNMSAKGYDTSKMQEVLVDVDAQIAALQNAINAGDLTALKDMREQIRGEHMHARARFAIERDRAILNAVKDSAVEKGYSSDVDQINSLLDSAATKASKGRPYEEGEFQQTWDQIKQANQLLRDLIRKIKGNTTGA